MLMSTIRFNINAYLHRFQFRINIKCKLIRSELSAKDDNCDNNRIMIKIKIMIIMDYCNSDNYANHNDRALDTILTSTR